LPELLIDVAVVGDATSAEALLIHSSGTHGVEGFTGSAIQVAYLRRLAAERPPPHVALVFIHAINALCMAESRWWNERGVDLNRNYMGPREGAVNGPKSLGWRRNVGVIEHARPARAPLCGGLTQRDAHRHAWLNAHVLMAPKMMHSCRAGSAQRAGRDRMVTHAAPHAALIGGRRLEAAAVAAARAATASAAKEIIAPHPA
jgi:hypothetical protein